MDPALFDGGDLTVNTNSYKLTFDDGAGTGGPLYAYAPPPTVIRSAPIRC